MRQKFICLLLGLFVANRAVYFITFYQADNDYREARQALNAEVRMSSESAVKLLSQRLLVEDDTGTPAAEFSDANAICDRSFRAAQP